MMRKKDGSKAIITLNTLVEANLLESVLKEQGIPHYIRTYHDSAYDGIWQDQIGWGVVEAPEDYRDVIIGIYNDLSEKQ